MMGGDGTNTDVELGELHLSAISEAMNQMMGSAATSLSSMLNKKIDISPPVADLIDLTGNIDEGAIDDFLTQPFVKISFKMEIGDLVDSEIMQLYPVSFAREMCKSITETMTGGNEPIQEATPQPAPAPAPQPQASQPAPQPQPPPTKKNPPANEGTADDGAANDGTTCRYVGNVCKPAGKCTAGSVPKFYWRYEWGISKGKY